MTTTIDTMEDLISVLDEKPEWAEALRSRLLSKEFIELPEQFARLSATVAQLAEKFVQQSERIDQLSATVAQLAEKFVQQSERIDQLTEAVAQLTVTVAQLVVAVAELQEGQRRMETRQDGFEARMDRFESTQQEMLQTQNEFRQSLQEFKQTQDELVRGQHRLEIVVGDLKGAFAIRVAVDEADEIAEAMGMRFIRVLDRAELRKLTESAAGRELPANDRRSFRRADLVIEAETSDGQPGYIAVEVSYTADARDTHRAVRNAGYLSRFTGQPAYAAVAASRRDNRVDHIFEQGQAFWYELEPDSLQAD